MAKMNVKIKARWIRALLSGKYKQTNGALRDTLVVFKGDKEEVKRLGYCCLGVLCDIYRRDHPRAKWYKDSFYPKGTGSLGVYGAHSILPTEVARWAGVEATGNLYLKEPLVVKTKEGKFSVNTLVDANDCARWKFKKIAALIKEHL